MTTETTLFSKGDNYFSAIVKKDFDNGKEIFIDRDPTHFRYILNYLRDGTVNIPTNVDICNEILNECNFYCLEKLTEIIKSQLTDEPKEYRILSNWNHISLESDVKNLMKDRWKLSTFSTAIKFTDSSDWGIFYSQSLYR